jgi:hypothetical protein
MAVQYFNSRYHSNFTGSELKELFKAITEPERFFEINGIRNPGYYQFEKSIGFLSADNSHIIFRNVTGEQSRRYCNLALTEDPGASKIYNISTDIDLLQDTVEIIMCEGVFDIIGVYNTFYQGQDSKNKIFAAACGKSYLSVIEKYTRMGFLNLKMVIYSDADVDTMFYKKMKASSYLMKTPITIFYNTLEKDFGVAPNRIKLRKTIV